MPKLEELTKPAKMSHEEILQRKDLFANAKGYGNWQSYQKSLSEKDPSFVNFHPGRFALHISQTGESPNAKEKEHGTEDNPNRRRRSRG